MYELRHQSSAAYADSDATACVDQREFHTIGFTLMALASVATGNTRDFIALMIALIDNAHYIQKMKNVYTITSMSFINYRTHTS